MARFRCKECGYNFDSEREEAPESCPYCSNKGTVKKEEDAEDLIEKL